MNFELTEDQIMIRDMVRDFTTRHVADGVIQRDREAKFAYDLVEKLSELGLMGMIYEEEMGGAGVDTVSFALAIEEIAKIDASLALTVASHTSLCTGHISMFGTDKLRKKYMPDLVQGKKLGGWGLTEPGSGSDASGMKTVAIKEGSDYVLNGSKTFITQGSVGSTYVILAVTDREKGTKGISAFVVERGFPGFSNSLKMDKLGMRSSDTAELILENVRVPEENLIGEKDLGFIQAMKVLDGGRIGIGALAVGIAQGALDRAVVHAKERIQFKQAIGQFQAIQFRLASMHTKVEAARNLVLRAAWLKDQGKSYSKEASIAKLYASEVGMEVCTGAIQVHGGYGYMDEYHVERAYRDMKLCEIGEGTSEVQKLVIARHLLK